MPSMWNQSSTSTEKIVAGLDPSIDMSLTPAVKLSERHLAEMSFGDCPLEAGRIRIDLGRNQNCDLYQRLGTVPAKSHGKARVLGTDLP